MNNILRKMAAKYWLRCGSTNFQAPAFAEAARYAFTIEALEGTWRQQERMWATRRQAKSQTISKFQFRMTSGFVSDFLQLMIGNYLEFGISMPAGSRLRRLRRLDPKQSPNS